MKNKPKTTQEAFGELSKELHKLMDIIYKQLGIYFLSEKLCKMLEKLNKKNEK